MGYSVTNAAKKHLTEDIELEFLPHYRQKDFDILKKIIIDEFFQVLDRKGEVVLNVQSSVHFNPSLNESNLEAAFSGRQVFETTEHQNNTYMISYFPLDTDSEHVGRITHSLEEMSHFRGILIKIMLFTLPFLLLISGIISRYLVHQSLKPIVKVLTYQETFSSNVTHELNSPLTSMKGNLEVILKRERTLQEYRETLKSVLRNVDGIIDLLNNLYLLATSKFKPLDLYKENDNI